MSSSKQLDIQFEDHHQKQKQSKWCYPLKEDGFAANLISLENMNPTVDKLFGSGSLFSPLLFGKFFDPSDAFPLWEFESDTLLPNLHSGVDWFQTDTDYVLKAQLPSGIISSNNRIQVCIQNNGKILEINGQHTESCRTKDWKIGHWWEYGFVRRLELPDQSNWRKSEAHLKNEVVLEIRVPKYNAEKLK